PATGGRRRGAPLGAGTGRWAGEAVQQFSHHAIYLALYERGRKCRIHSPSIEPEITWRSGALSLESGTPPEVPRRSGRVSSEGILHPLKVKTRVRIPLGLQEKRASQKRFPRARVQTRALVAAEGGSLGGLPQKRRESRH